MPLFTDEPFTSHSGLKLDWKIDCDAIQDSEWALFARLFASKYSFSKVVGIPRGGLKFAEALKPYVKPGLHYPTLIADDVYTTGTSMKEALNSIEGDVVGVVLFARATCPGWVIPMLRLGWLWQTGE